MPESVRDSRFGAFLSYTRHDDDHDIGRITDMRLRLAAEVRMQLGEAFVIFQDRESIFTGQQWDDRIFGALTQSILLITVITPSFLRSDSCRQEVQAFVNHEQSLGRDDLIIPILYIPTPGLENSDDKVAVVLKGRQHFDWADLRFVDLKSNDMRRGIAKLAQQVVNAVNRSGSRLAVSRTSDSGSTPVGTPADKQNREEFGFLDLIAEAEDAFPLFNVVLVSLMDLMREITDITTQATSDLQEARISQRPAAAGVIAARRFAHRLEVPVSQIETVADEYLDQLARIGGGIRALTDLVAKARSGDDLVVARRFSTTLEELANAADTGMQSIATLRMAVINNYNISRSLRPVLRRMSNALGRIEPTNIEIATWRDNYSKALQERERQS